MSQQSKPSITEAKKIITDYAQKCSTVDEGNLYFAATQLESALDEARKEIERLREHIGRTSGLYTCPTCGEDVSNEPGHFKSYGAMQVDLDTANALLEWILAEMKTCRKNWCGTKGCECYVCRTIEKIEQHGEGK